MRSAADLDDGRDTPNPGEGGVLEATGMAEYSNASSSFTSLGNVTEIRNSIMHFSRTRLPRSTPMPSKASFSERRFAQCCHVLD